FLCAGPPSVGAAMSHTTLPKAQATLPPFAFQARTRSRQARPSGGGVGVTRVERRTLVVSRTCRSMRSERPPSVWYQASNSAGMGKLAVRSSGWAVTLRRPHLVEKAREKL